VLGEVVLGGGEAGVVVTDGRGSGLWLPRSAAVVGLDSGPGVWEVGVVLCPVAGMLPQGTGELGCGGHGGMLDGGLVGGSQLGVCEAGGPELGVSEAGGAGTDGGGGEVGEVGRGVGVVVGRVVGGEVRGLLGASARAGVDAWPVRRLRCVLQTTGGSGLGVDGGVVDGGVVVQVVGVADGFAGAGVKLLARTGTAPAVPPSRSVPPSRMV
jgi:hypothetical protein